MIKQKIKIRRIAINIAIIVVVFSLSSFSKYVEDSDNFSLTVDVKGLRNSTGIVQFSLYNKKGSIPDEKFKKYYKQKTRFIEELKSSVVFSDLPKGVYVINVLHDENENSEIDKGFILPKEGIGFSNFKSIGLMNRPNYKKASFSLESDMTKTIKVIYF